MSWEDDDEVEELCVLCHMGKQVRDTECCKACLEATEEFLDDDDLDERGDMTNLKDY